MSLPQEPLRRLVAAALEEDLGRTGDITTDAVIPPGLRAIGRLMARTELVLAGIDVAREVFRALDETLEFSALAEDGRALPADSVVATIRGDPRPILRGERTALNFLMRMCGIASAARDAEREIAGTGARILDTRKTAPGLRLLDKYAVAAGGALNHRHGLFDAVMIKDTHLGAIGTLGQAVRAARERGVPPERITAEVRTMGELLEAIEAGAGRALLDNMSLVELREAVRAAHGRIALEASGGLVPGRLRQVAETGVNYLSVGWLTHSAPAADLALELELLP